MPGNSNSRSRAVAPATTKTVRRDLNVAKGFAPTLSHNLSRVTVTLAEQAPTCDAQEGYDELWPDIPEELEPTDDDAVDDDDLGPGGVYIRHPLIVYSRASSWAPPPDAVAAESDGIDGDLRVTIRVPEGGPREHDPRTLAIIRDELHRIAAALERMQSRALSADDRVDAVAKLVPMTARTLAAEFGNPQSTGPLLSKRRREIVETPWGQVPLEFFWWLEEGGLSVVEARQLIVELRTDPARPALAIARCVAEAHAQSASVANRADATRHQVPQMQALLPFIPMLNMLSRNLVDVGRKELERVVGDAVFEETGVLLKKRGARLVLLGLAGAYEGLEVTQ